MNTDNPKLAARYFLNAIDRVEALKEKYQKNLVELEKNIEMMEQIVTKPFEKDTELSGLKADVARLEREISIRIQTSHMKQQDSASLSVDAEQMKGENVKLKEAPVIRMDTDSERKEQIEKPLLMKKEFSQRRERGLRM